MKSIVVIFALLLSTVAYADDNQYAPTQNDRIVLYQVTSENENAPKYSGYYRDSNGVVHRVALWSGRSDKYLEGPVTLPEVETQ